MTSTLFRKFPLVKQSLAQRLFRQFPEENAIIELNNLLATRAIREITFQDVDQIQSKYGIDIRTEYRLNLEEFYSVYLAHCLKDHSLDEEELENLRHLKSLFLLPDFIIEQLHNEIGKTIYRQSFEEAVADGRLSNEEQHFLSELEQTLRLPKEISSKIALEAKKGVFQQYVDTASEDHRLSPEEEKEIQAIAASLGLKISSNSASTKKLNQLKHYWSLENLDLLPIETDLKLQKLEICYFECSNVDWWKVSGRNWTVVNLNSNPKEVFTGKESTIDSVYRHQLTRVDSGSVYLTNQRIIFEGLEKKTTIKFDKVLRIKTFSDGIEILRETGKNPILRFSEKADEFGIILNRLLRNH